MREKYALSFAEKNNTGGGFVLVRDPAFGAASQFGFAQDETGKDDTGRVDLRRGIYEKIGKIIKHHM